MRDQATKHCSIAGCDKPYWSRGFCRMHYQRWLTHGDPLMVLTRGYKPGAPKPCSVEGCPRRHYAQGWCRNHYRAWAEHGDPLFTMRHGGSTWPEYFVWNAMKARCLNPKNQWYSRYGGRGIRVCDRWLDSFADFIIDMGRRPSAEYSIDRINNDGGYEPTNCRWTTIDVQNANRPHWATRKTECKNGHPFDEANTRISVNGRRTCRTCQKQRVAKFIERHDNPRKVHSEASLYPVVDLRGQQ